MAMRVVSGCCSTAGRRRVVSGAGGSDATLLLVYNAHFDVVNFTLPNVADGKDWLALIDTNQPEGQLASFPFGHIYAVTGRSMVAFGLSAEDIVGREERGFQAGAG
jgi:isoamylase